MATQERDEFADLLSGLTSEQWNAPSLCGDWRVRDVAAHVIGYLDRSRAAFAFALVKHRFHVDRLNAADVKRYSVCRPEEIVNAMRDRAAPRGVGSGFGNRIALVESMIHQQDIRRALNRPRAIPAERLAAALQFTTAAPLIRGGWYTRGVRLVATDVEWASGRGPEVRGLGEALLMTMARRRGVLAELTGPGVRILSGRSR